MEYFDVKLAYLVVGDSFGGLWYNCAQGFGRFYEINSHTGRGFRLRDCICAAFSRCEDYSVGYSVRGVVGNWYSRRGRSRNAYVS